MYNYGLTKEFKQIHLPLVQWIEHEASTFKMWVQFLQGGPITMPKIYNLSKAEVEKVSYSTRKPYAGYAIMRILDPAMHFKSVSYCDFVDEVRFEFLDATPEECVMYGWPSEFMITDEQAEQIAAKLLEWEGRGLNIIVHCHAGLCRSGAVTLAMVERGYDDPILENEDKYERIPNKYVFDKIVSAMKNLELKS